MWTLRTSRQVAEHRLAACAPQSGERGETLNQEQRRIFQQVAELFEIDRAERAVDNPMVAAHPDRHAMTDNDLIAIIDDRHFVDFADGENEALWWINDGGKTVDPHATEI